LFLHHSTSVDQRLAEVVVGRPAAVAADGDGDVAADLDDALQDLLLRWDAGGQLRGSGEGCLGYVCVNEDLLRRLARSSGMASALPSAAAAAGGGLLPAAGWLLPAAAAGWLLSAAAAGWLLPAAGGGLIGFDCSHASAAAITSCVSVSTSIGSGMSTHVLTAVF
jgi:hypothetical protein